MDNHPPHRRLRAFRALLELNQSELAAMLHVRRETVSNLETGRHRPGPVLADRISRLTEIPVAAWKDNE